MVEGDRVLVFYVTTTGVSVRYTSSYALDWNTTQEEARAALDTNTLWAVLANQYFLPSETYDACTELAFQAIPLGMAQVDGNEKMAFVFYPGKWYNEGNGTSKFNLVTGIDEAVDEGIKVHTISLGDSTNPYIDNQIARTGGESFIATTTDELKEQIQEYLDAEANPSHTVETFDYIDSDGDGLYDTYEINGMRIQNGTVAYTDPYNSDSDGDGISDYEEMGGTPESWIIYAQFREYTCVINRQISDPNEMNLSNDASAPDKYIIVDNIEYLPYSQVSYNKIFIDNTNKVDSQGNPIYGLQNICYSNPNELTQEEINWCVTRVCMQCALVKKDLPYASKFLLQYIGNMETRHFYDATKPLGMTIIGRSAFIEDMQNILWAAIEELDGRDSVILALSPDAMNHGVTYSPLYIDYFLAIHSAETRVVVQIERVEDTYTATIKYYLYDYYDWDESIDVNLSLVNDQEMYQLCRCGAAQFYENWGLYETEIEWKEEEYLGMNNSTLAEQLAIRLKDIIYYQALSYPDIPFEVDPYEK